MKVFKENKVEKSKYKEEMRKTISKIKGEINIIVNNPDIEALLVVTNNSCLTLGSKVDILYSITLLILELKNKKVLDDKDISILMKNIIKFV